MMTIHRGAAAYIWMVYLCVVPIIHIVLSFWALLCWCSSFLLFSFLGRWMTRLVFLFPRMYAHFIYATDGCILRVWAVFSSALLFFTIDQRPSALQCLAVYILLVLCAIYVMDVKTGGTYTTFFYVFDFSHTQRVEYTVELKQLVFRSPSLDLLGFFFFGFRSCTSGC